MITKSKKVIKQMAKKACRQHLRFLERNVSIIQHHVDQSIWNIARSAPSWHRKFLIITELVRQPRLINIDSQRSISNRIVSIDQPHVHPMVRGQAGTPVEFGAKIAVTHDDGFAFLERISWDALSRRQ